MIVQACDSGNQLPGATSDHVEQAKCCGKDGEPEEPAGVLINGGCSGQGQRGVRTRLASYLRSFAFSFSNSSAVSAPWSKSFFSLSS
jgi:hypothetical protein